MLLGVFPRCFSVFLLVYGCLGGDFRYATGGAALFGVWCLYDGAALLVEAVQVECWLLMEIQILTESLDNVFTNGIPFRFLLRL